MSDKCKRCGACKECGAITPQPYPYQVYPNYYPPYPVYYPQTTWTVRCGSGGISGSSSYPPPQNLC